MIEEIAAKNFKSLGDFKLKLEPFTCLIGMNGAGKTSILQAIDFMSQLMVGRIDDWLEMREWVSGDLVSKFSPSANIQLALSFRTDGGQLVRWDGQFNRHALACSSENLTVDGETVLTVRGQVLKVHGTAELQGPHRLQLPGLGAVAIERRQLAASRAGLPRRDAKDPFAGVAGTELDAPPCPQFGKRYRSGG